MLTMDEESKNTKIKSKEYPAVSLEQAINFIIKLKGYPLDKPIKYSDAAKTLGISDNTKSFTYTISAARQFGLISTSSGRTFSFLEPAKQIAYPTKDTDIASIKIQCFRSPKLYAQLTEEFKGHEMPTQDILENTLVAHYGIAPNAKEKAAKAFIDSANEANVVKEGILDFSQESKESDDLFFEKQDDEKAIMDGMPDKKYDEFGPPLTIPFGDARRAMLYMPIDTSQKDAEYVQEMIKLMFKNVYGVE